MDVIISVGYRVKSKVGVEFRRWAAQLLYSIIKGHPFSDGNKRIGSFVFVWFLEQNNYHLNENSERKISDNTLVALALAVAQSVSQQKDTIKKLIMNMIKNYT